MEKFLSGVNRGIDVAGAAGKQHNQGAWTTEDVLGLSTVTRLSSVAIRRLITRYHSLQHALDEAPHELEKLGLANRNIFGEPAAKRISAAAAHELERCAAAHARVISIIDDEYPFTLKAIQHPPAILYVRGTLSPESDGIAIVGTRRCSPYGASITRTFAEEFTAAGCSIVSGLARGIDTHAHRATVQCGGITYAVIASGVDRVSPTENAALANEIIEAGGAVISEYPCGTRAVSAYFPRRNRIICGLAAVVIVTESALAGGAMISAEMARTQGRPVYAVPGPINAATSAGTNKLIQNGHARMACSPKEILKTLGRSQKMAQRETMPRLEKHEAAIHALVLRGACHIDDIQHESNQNLAEVMATLVRLESRGLVQSLPGNRYAKQLQDRV